LKIVSYQQAGGVTGDGSPRDSWRAGVLREDGVIDVASLAIDWPEGEAPRSVREVLERGKPALARIAEACADVPQDVLLARDEVRVGPPVPDPDKIICIGLNYFEHVGEVDMEVPPAPILFAKFRNCLQAHEAPIILPPHTDQVDYEGELAVVIGARCKNATRESALDHVAGYMPFNDVSARDLQMQVSQWTTGKAVDTFAPCGPALVTADEVGDPSELEIRTRLNGEVVQEAPTSLMMFDVPSLIEFISRNITLEPGDIIATGTPAGVGFTREPPLFLREGDLVEVEIEKVGLLANPVQR
jgi:2-keto-4-pentenoate hydratase/2-oxohepta-3-ene-1,7-dioic acid hydratase in catechol pathway